MTKAAGRIRRMATFACAPLLALALEVTVLEATALAQERPSEDEMFGDPAEPPKSEGESEAAVPEGQTPAQAAPPQAQPRVGTEASRDESILGGSRAPMFSEEAAPDDPLTIGGQLYLRTQASFREGAAFEDTGFSAPTFLDVYLDARPNERVRGFVLTRVFYDPSVADGGSGAQSVPAGSGAAGSGQLSDLFQGGTRGPNLVLDQAWINFDIARSVFVTAGSQHVRWGTGRFWVPTDYLHLTRRNPLDVFDARTGTALIKAHVPIESLAWNFYGYAVLEDEFSTTSLGAIAGAARMELVLGPAELGLGVFARRHEKARFAADLSFGLGDFDFYGELALRAESEIDRVHFAPDAALPPEQPGPSWQTPEEANFEELGRAIDVFYPRYRNDGYTAQAVGGLAFSRKYNDNDVWSLGAEYFYNGLGYGSPQAYSGLVLPHSTPLENPAPFFYLGKVYAALFFSMPAPYSLDNHTFTLSTLGNLSDRSFITRFDYSFLALTHLRFEAFVAARYGNENGEFRFGASNLEIGGFTFSRPPALLDFGLALRISI